MYSDRKQVNSSLEMAGGGNEMKGLITLRHKKSGGVIDMFITSVVMMIF